MDWILLFLKFLKNQENITYLKFEIFLKWINRFALPSAVLAATADQNLENIIKKN